MKNLAALSILIYFIGFILKFFHLPLTAIIMLVGLFLMIIALGYGVIAKKIDRLGALTGFAMAMWMGVLLCSVKFWWTVNIFLAIAAVLTLLAIRQAFKDNHRGQLKLMAFSLCLSLFFYFMPTDTRYYLISIKWNHEIETDYFSWDKYSWFLYNNQKYDEALVASDKAVQLAQQSGLEDWIEFISEHNEKIRAQNWTSFR